MGRTHHEADLLSDDPGGPELDFDGTPLEPLGPCPPELDPYLPATEAEEQRAMDLLRTLLKVEQDAGDSFWPSPATRISLVETLRRVAAELSR